MDRLLPILSCLAFLRGEQGKLNIHSYCLSPHSSRSMLDRLLDSILDVAFGNFLNKRGDACVAGNDHASHPQNKVGIRACQVCGVLTSQKKVRCADKACDYLTTIPINVDRFRCPSCQLDQVLPKESLKCFTSPSSSGLRESPGAAFSRAPLVSSSLSRSSVLKSPSSRAEEIKFLKSRSGEMSRRPLTLSRAHAN